MATMISDIPMLNNKILSSIPNAIPSEIILQFDIITSTGSSEDSEPMYHNRQASDTVNCQTIFEDNSIDGSKYNGEVISLSLDCNSSYELPDMLPLDYRLGWSIDAHDNSRSCISQSASNFRNDTACMKMDSFCVGSNEWEIESVYGDSLDTEEDISSIPEWINSVEDFWTF